LTEGAAAASSPLALGADAVSHAFAVAMLLSAASGYVDAVVYLRVQQVFTANQSGNLILLGIGLGNGELSSAVASAASLVVYVLAAALGVAVFDDRRPGAGGRGRFTGVLGLELASLAGLALLLWLVLPDRDDTTRLEAWPTVIVAVASAAMGLQAVAIRSVGRVAVLTTGATGNVTNIGVAVARLLPEPLRHEAATWVGITTGVLAAYVAGAAAGAGGLRLVHAPEAAVLLPMVAVLAALVSGRRPRPA